MRERERGRESTEQERAWLTPLLKPEGAHQKIRGRKFQRAVHGVFFDESHTNYDLATVSAAFWRRQRQKHLFSPELRITKQFSIPAHAGKMKAKNRDQSLSDSRELDGSYDQLTGK